MTDVAPPARMTSAVLARHDRPGPRYTSYPTAVDFHEDFGRDDHAATLRAASNRVDEPLSLYVHVPFCESRCSFCACHVVISKSETLTAAYRRRVVAEARLTADLLGQRRTVHQYHWGGGTPTFFTPDEMADLHRGILSHFTLADDAEVALEVDPRVTTDEHLAVLRQLGFNRISMGVQDLDQDVQRLIGRNQTWDQTAGLHRSARSLGYESINLDLVYGLPGQDEATFERTLDQVISLHPDRLAVYSFALVPWMRPHQKRIDQSRLPDRDAKFALLALAIEKLTSAGYVQIGMDHFATPDDELAVAYRSGTLSRNFMGYTTRRGLEMVGLGTSAISDIGSAYAQNHRRLASYQDDLDGGVLPVERGVALSGDDQIRRHVITELMCNGRLIAADIDRRFGISCADYFADEFASLTGPDGAVAAGFVVVDGADIEATEVGRVFIRNVAMVFDSRLPKALDSSSPVFSRTV